MLVSFLSGTTPTTAPSMLATSSTTLHVFSSTWDSSTDLAVALTCLIPNVRNSVKLLLSLLNGCCKEKSFCHILTDATSVILIAVFSDIVPNSLLAMHHPEDTFIDSMALGKLVVSSSSGGITAGSLEGIIARIIDVIS